MNAGGKQVANDSDRHSDSEGESMIDNQKEWREVDCVFEHWARANP
jgi:hypothetical protein